MPLFDPRHRSDERRDRAFHVVGAAPGDQSVGDRGLERVAAPAFARRDDVEMAGEAEVRRSRAADRDHIFHGAVRGLAGDEAMHFEPERPKRRFEHVENLTLGRRDARAVDQRARKVDGVD